MIQPEPISMLHKSTRRKSNLLLLFALLSWQIQAVQSRGLRATQELLDEQNEEDEVIDVYDEIDLSDQHQNDGDEEGVFIEGDILATWDSISQLYSPEYALELGLHPPSEEKENLMSSSIQDAIESKEAMIQIPAASNSTEPIEKQEINARMTPLPPSSNGQEAPLNPPNGDPVGYPVPLIPLPPPDSPEPYPEDEEDEQGPDFYWSGSFNEKMDMYEFHVHVSREEYTPAQFRKIKKALRQLTRLTGVMHIQFYRTRQPPSNVDYIRVFKGDGCWSALGQTSRSRGQDLSLDSSCLVTGTIQHEFMHAMGFYHTHMRPDRDDYVTINEENIKDGGHGNFKKVVNGDTLGTQYDYDSVLHYGAYQFSKNNQPTIDAKGNPIGQRKKVSIGDRLTIRLHYQCSDGPRSLEEYKNETCNDSNCKCGFKMKGCGGDSNKCKGNLVCRNNKCLRPKPAA